MTKKILLSVVASALLTTITASAGQIFTDTGHAKITQESYLQNGMDVINFSSFKYVAEINNNGSLSISDPLIRIDVSDIEIPRVGAHAATSGDNSAERFDQHGRGLLLSSVAQDVNISVAADDQKNEFEEHFKGTWLVDVDTGTAIPFDNVNAEAGKMYLNFTGSSSDSIINGHTYVLSTDPTDADAEVDIDFKYVRGNQKMSLKTYSQTLDNNLQDEAEFVNTTEFPPQFKVNCVRKFDGLINFENDRTTFVNPSHGDRIGAVAGAMVDPDGAANGADVNSDTVIDRDRMIFTIWNERDGSADTRYMGGHGTEYMFDVSNNNNRFGAASDAEWSYNIKTLTGLEGLPADLDDNTSDTLYASTLTSTVAFAANTFTITHPLTTPIPAGLTTYQLDLVSLDGNTPIRPVVFSNPKVDLEGGLTPNNIDTEDTASQTEVNHGVAAPAGDITNNYITNSVLDSGTGTTDSVDGSITDGGTGQSRTGVIGRGDSDDVIVPQMDGSNTSDTVGEWMDHAYIAQIAGATQNPGVVESKFFIVNRSCAVATPTFKLIQDGKVAIIKGNPIAVDSQAKVKMADLVASPEAVAAGMTGTQFAVEIILGGVAEDFYIYAQSLTSAGATKDLPVYNTSNRD